MLVPEITFSTMESASIIMAALDSERLHYRRLADVHCDEPALRGYYIYRAGVCQRLRDEASHQFEALWNAEIGTTEWTVPSE